MRCARRRTAGQGLVVSGCLPQRFREQLPKLLPEVDAFMGIDQVAQVSDIVKASCWTRRAQRIDSAPTAADAKSKVVAELNALPTAAPATPLVASDAAAAVHPGLRHAAFSPDAAPFRLSQNCRGLQSSLQLLHHSRGCAVRIGAVRNATSFGKRGNCLRDGVKELNLISQDSTYYGLDLRPARNGRSRRPKTSRRRRKRLPADTTTLCSLLRELNALPGDFWIRLLYTHPAHWTDELIADDCRMPESGALRGHAAAAYPSRTCSSGCAARRRSEYIVDLIERIRAGIPGIALRTTFIVGFPGETEACFESLLEFIRDDEVRAAGRLHLFARGRHARGENGRPDAGCREAGNAATAAMAEQLKVAAAGREIVRRAANCSVLGGKSRRMQENWLPRRVSSWEHGLVRSRRSSRRCRPRPLPGLPRRSRRAGH